MKVLMISKACVTDTYRSKLRHLTALEGGAVDLTLVVPPRWGSLAFEPSREDTYPILQLPITFNGQNHLHWYRGLAGVIARVQPDLIHIDEEHYSGVTWQAMRLSVRYRIPALFFTWQNLYKRYPWPFSGIEHYVFHHAQAGIAGNQEAETVLRQKGFRGPIWVIPQFGTDPDRFYPAPSDALKNDLALHGTTVIGYVGRLIPEKGLDTLMEAMIPLLRAHPELRLLLAGSGPWHAVAQEQAQSAAVANQVLLVPWMPSTRMPELMNSLDVLVLPSRTTPRWKEQFGRVLTEAMACEVAVVGSSSGEIPPVIGDAGRVFPEGDPQALAAILQALLENPQERLALAQKGRRRVLAHFTQKAIAQKTLDVYRQLLSSRSSP